MNKLLLIIAALLCAGTAGAREIGYNDLIGEWYIQPTQYKFTMGNESLCKLYVTKAEVIVGCERGTAVYRNLLLYTGESGKNSVSVRKPIEIYHTDPTFLDFILSRDRSTGYGWGRFHDGASEPFMIIKIER